MMMRSKVIAVAIVTVLLLAVGFFVFRQTALQTEISSAPPARPSVTIGGQVITVELADTSEKQRRGLSGRDRLAENAGMLFLFPAPAQQTFWMKDMKFPLDIIWLRGQWVLGFVENAQPSAGDSIPTFTSPPNTDVVLEVSAGTVQRLGIKAGDVIELSI